METGQDRWTTFLTGRGEVLTSILVNEAYRGDPPAGKSSLLIAELPLLEPREDGLANEKEFRRLTALEENIAAAAYMAGAEYAGRVTAAGRRTFYFYCEHPAAVRTALESALQGEKEYNLEFREETDPEWSTYRDSLLPSPEEHQRSKNWEAIQTLKRNGDALEDPRPVRHFLDYPDEQRRREAAVWATARGFASEEKPPAENRFPLVLTRIDRVDPASLDEVSLMLLQKAQESGAEYDGWESEVIRKKKGLLGWLRR